MAPTAKPDFTPSGALLGLATDATGPYWLTRTGSSLRIEDPSGLVVGPFEMIGTREGAKAAPSLLAGSRAVLYMGPDKRLWVNGVPVAGLGAHLWEGFCGASLEPGAVLWAHDVDGSGHDRAYATAPNTWTPAEPPPWPPGSPLFFAGCSTVAAPGAVACIWRNNAAIRVVRGTVESFRTGYNPERQEWTPPKSPKGAFYGDPQGCMEGSGAVHWAAALWIRHRIGVGNPTDWSECLGRVVLDGAEVVTGAIPEHKPGQSPVAGDQWTPAVAVAPIGTVLAWQSRMPVKGRDPGEVTVGLVRAGRVVAGSERSFPGFQPRLAVTADGRVAVGTSAGIWVGK